MCQICMHSTVQSTYPSWYRFQPTILDTVLYHSGLCCWTQIWHIFILTLSSFKGNIWPLKPAMVKNEVSLQSGKNMLSNDIQYNTPQPQVTPEMYVFQTIPSFLWRVYYVGTSSKWLFQIMLSLPPPEGLHFQHYCYVFTK